MCSCARCSVSMLDQIRFGLTLGYKPCCIAEKLGLEPLQPKPYPWNLPKKPWQDWCNKTRREEGIPWRTAWIRKHLQEATGLTEFEPCWDCVDVLEEHVWNNLWRGKQTKTAWREASRMVVGSRKWALSNDPPLEQLRKQADKDYPAGTAQQKASIIKEFKEQARVQ